MRLYLIIKAERSVRKMIKDRKILLSQADAILTELNNSLKDKGKVSTIELSLIEDDRVVFRDELELGNDMFQSLILFVTNTLENIFVDIPESDKNEFLDKLIAEIHGSSFLDNEIKGENVPSYTNQESKEIENAELNVQTKKQSSILIKLFKSKKERYILLFSVLILFIGVAFYWTYFMSAIPLNNRLQQAFNNEDYATVVQSNGESKTDLLLKAKAYIKLSKVNEAEKINKELKNKDVTYLINEFYIRETYRFIQEKNLTAADELVLKVDNKQLAKNVERAKEIVTLLGLIDNQLKATNQDTVERLRSHLTREYELIQFNAY